MQRKSKFVKAVYICVQPLLLFMTLGLSLQESNFAPSLFWIAMLANGVTFTLLALFVLRCPKPERPQRIAALSAYVAAFLLSFLFPYQFNLFIAYPFLWTGISLFLSRESLGRMSFGVLKAPQGPLLSDIRLCSTEDEARLTAGRFVSRFDEVMSATSDRMQPKQITYIDGLRVVQLFSLRTPGDAKEFRSVAFRARQHFDEYWFVLHIKIEKGGFSYDLDAVGRNRSLLLLGFMLFLPLLVVLWLCGLTGLVAVLIPVFAGFCWIDQVVTGGAVVEWIGNKERGERRRAEKIKEYKPLAIYALQEALDLCQGAPTGVATSPVAAPSAVPNPNYQAVTYQSRTTLAEQPNRRD